MDIFSYEEISPLLFCPFKKAYNVSLKSVQRHSTYRRRNCPRSLKASLVRHQCISHTALRGSVWVILKLIMELLKTLQGFVVPKALECLAPVPSLSSLPPGPAVLSYLYFPACAVLMQAPGFCPCTALCPGCPLPPPGHLTNAHWPLWHRLAMMCLGAFTVCGEFGGSLPQAPTATGSGFTLVSGSSP